MQPGDCADEPTDQTSQDRCTPIRFGNECQTFRAKTIPALFHLTNQLRQKSRSLLYQWLLYQSSLTLR